MRTQRSSQLNLQKLAIGVNALLDATTAEGIQPQFQLVDKISLFFSLHFLA
jgi:hypothetical protein